MVCKLLVFAKAPVPGQVKTRLAPVLGATDAARLQQALTRHTLGCAIAAGVGPVELWCAPQVSHPFFADCADRFAVSLRDQPAGDLGSRMDAALADALATASAAIVIGTDCPAMDQGRLRQAASALANGFDAVLGPAEDGGYVLIGLRRPAQPLFDGIAWSSSSVLESSRGRLRALGYRWSELDTLWDVDRPDDYRRMVAQRCLAGWTGPDGS